MSDQSWPFPPLRGGDPHAANAAPGPVSPGPPDARPADIAPIVAPYPQAMPRRWQWPRPRELASRVRRRLLRLIRRGRHAGSETFSKGFVRLVLRRPRALHAALAMLRLVAPRQMALAQMQAVLAARLKGWKAAAPLFLQAERRRRAAPSALPRLLLASARPAQGLDLCVPRDDRPLDLPADLAEKIVVYTACFGRRPYLPPLVGQPEGLRFVCFTDTPVSVPGWEVVVAPAPRGGEAFLRICPHRALPAAVRGATWSLFIDSRRIAVGNLHTLLTRWLMQHDMVVWRHPAAGDWHGLAEHALLAGTHPASAVLAQAEACSTASIPRHRGAIDTGMIWRRHADPAVEARMEAWWALHETEPEGDPALSWCRSAHQVGASAARVAQMPSALGTADRNIFFAHNDPKPGALKPRLPSPGLLLGKIPVTFLFAEERALSGITLLRARQLSRMVAEAFPDRYDVTLRSDIGGVRDQVVIVNRGAIEFNKLAHLHDLRDRNIASISDFLDMPIKAKTSAAFDAHMTLCLPQAVELNRLYPSTPSFHVTHHVNSDVPQCVPLSDKLRTAYFGRLGNTSRPESLEEMVALVNVVDASFTAQDWARLAPLYNCHWIVRQKDDLQEWKPFLKGFVAARCGAVVIVTRDDMNAMHYLGDDYPFYAESLAPEDLEWAWVKVAAAFGGPEWRKAQGIMRQVAARCSRVQVITEFKAMLDEILS